MDLKISKLLLLLLTLSTCCSSLQNTFKTEKSNILMLLPFGSTSHQNIFLPLAKSLAERGHEITILSGLPPKANHNKIIEINHGIDFISDVDMFKQRESDNQGGMGIFKTFLPKLAREIYDVPEVMKLYERKNQFDLIVIDELFNEFAYPFLHGQSFIFLCTGEFMPPSSAILGNPLHPAYVPHFITSNNCENFLERWKNLFLHIFFPFTWRHWMIVPLVQNEISPRFPDLPPLLEIERNFSLILSNSHFSTDTIFPILPNQIQVGGMHIKPAKPLPEDLKNWIEGAGSEGVIYFSLGSVAKGKTMPTKYRNIIIEAFSKMKQRVIWKFEEEISGLSSNVLLRSWLPQQDILAHPNVKVFITHGGLLSLQESLYHGTPLLTIPIFGDQPKNGMKIEKSNYGRMIIWEQLTVASLIDILNEIIQNPVYSNTVKRTSTLFKDKPATAVETALWWTEYVIRHKGAPHLLSSAKDLSWIQFLYIDLLVAVHLTGFLIFWLVRKCVRFICCNSDKYNIKLVTSIKKTQ